jgi:AcrR family transcriptional regulator
MRNKDENKNEAIFRATIQLLNEVGFAEISMSKIAKGANVSPSTIYVYFENKEDMIKKLYLNVKEKLSIAMLHGIDRESSPTKIVFELIMKNLMEYILKNQEDFLFLEQFSNSPLIGRLCSEETMWFFKPHNEIVEKGKKANILKQGASEVLMNYCYFPVTQLAKKYIKENKEFDKNEFDQIVRMSWDAIKV